MNAWRAAAEVALELGCVFAAIWGGTSLQIPGLRAILVAVAVGFPAVCIIRAQRTFPEFALRHPALPASARAVFWFTLASTALLLILRYASQRLNYAIAAGQPLSVGFMEHLAFAFLQQIGLQLFLTRRMEAIFTSPSLASAAAALAFASIHFPNPVLLVLTFVAGVFWSRTFQRAPNLYPLAVSHAWSATLIAYCIPRLWLHNLRIGPSYWQF
jgi:hypothetical protein